MVDDWCVPPVNAIFETIKPLSAELSNLANPIITVINPEILIHHITTDTSYNVAQIGGLVDLAGYNILHTIILSHVMCDYRRGLDWWIDLLTTYSRNYK
jgi:hypothetical protein